MKKELRKDYEIEKIAKDTYRLHEYGAANMYLLFGDEKALLIDVGVGVGDLLGAVRELTDLPLAVAATHAHPDHIGGMDQFEEIYLHPADLRNKKYWGNNFMRLGYMLSVKWILKDGVGISDVITHKKDKKNKKYKTSFPSMPESFDLGGRIVNVIHTPGHTKGSVIFLDEREKIMLTGDNANPTLFHWLPGAVPIEEWLAGAEIIRDLSKAYTPYDGHDDGLQSHEQIGEVIDLGKELLSQNKKNKKISRLRVFPSWKSRPRIIYRNGNLFSKSH